MNHNALVHWLPLAAVGWPALPTELQIIALSRFAEDEPGWPDGAWSLVLQFEEPPIEQDENSPMRATVCFAFRTAPHERLRAGIRCGVYYGLTKVADVDVLD